MEEKNSMNQNIIDYSKAVSNYYKDPQDPANYEEKETNNAVDQSQEPVIQAQADTSESVETPKENSKSYNLRILRERAAEEERKRREAEERAAYLEEQNRYLKEQSQQQLPRNAQSNTPEEAESELADDDIPTWGQQKKFLKRLEQQLLNQREELVRTQKQSAALEAEKEFKRIHADAESILTKENIDMLKRIYPEDFEGIINNPNEYGKLKSAYNMIKNYGILEEKETEERIQKNSRQPRPASVGNAQVSDSPLVKIDEHGRRHLTEAYKEQIRKRVAQARGVVY